MNGKPVYEGPAPFNDRRLASHEVIVPRNLLRHGDLLECARRHGRGAGIKANHSKMAGITDPPNGIDFAEPYDPFDYKELHHMPAGKFRQLLSSMESCVHSSL